MRPRTVHEINTGNNFAIELSWLIIDHHSMMENALASLLALGSGVRGIQ